MTILEFHDNEFGNINFVHKLPIAFIDISKPINLVTNGGVNHRSSLCADLFNREPNRKSWLRIEVAGQEVYFANYLNGLPLSFNESLNQFIDENTIGDIIVTFNSSACFAGTLRSTNFLDTIFTFIERPVVNLATISGQGSLVIINEPGFSEFSSQGEFTIVNPSNENIQYSSSIGKNGTVPANGEIIEILDSNENIGEITIELFVIGDSTPFKIKTIKFSQEVIDRTQTVRIDKFVNYLQLSGEVAILTTQVFFTVDNSKSENEAVTNGNINYFGSTSISVITEGKTIKSYAFEHTAIDTLDAINSTRGEFRVNGQSQIFRPANNLIQDVPPPLPEDVPEEQIPGEFPLVPVLAAIGIAAVGGIVVAMKMKKS